MKELFIS